MIVEIAFLEPKFNFKRGYGPNFFDFLLHFGGMALFRAREGNPQSPEHIFRPISPEPVQVQTSNLYQIVALNMLIKKGNWVYGAKFNSLGAGSQNDNSPAKMLKIAVF